MVCHVCEVRGDCGRGVCGRGVGGGVWGGRGGGNVRD